jgi:hypothetical protein
MSGNKPFAHNPKEFSSKFTARIAAHPRVAYFPIPKTQVVVMMVIDELLVNGNALNHSLLGHLNSNAKHIGGVFDSDPDLVQIWQLNSAPGNKSVPDVAAAVWEARKFLSHSDASHVAPNHVIVPSPNFHMCPWGPPEEGPKGDTPDLGHEASTARVTVIDAGYVDGGPIDARLERPARFGEYFSPGAANPWPVEPMSIGADPLDQNGDHRLDALVGHASFVAGVVAQAYQTVKIDIVSHNGSFVERDASLPIPTEAAVARSLWEELTADPPSDVINVGFAFPTLPYVPPIGAPVGGPPSWTFQAVLNATNGTQTLIVAPAGNQNSFLPQWPAAFYVNYPDRVIGVGSITNAGTATAPVWVKSEFSNYGKWVACCTAGVNVVSSFVDGWDNKPTEEAEETGTPHPNKTFRGWATWEGTSFAAPKVSGAIAASVAASGSGLLAPITPLQAWQSLVSGRGGGGLDMGARLDGLAPD